MSDNYEPKGQTLYKGEFRATIDHKAFTGIIKGIQLTGLKYHRCSWWRRLLRLRCPHDVQPLRSSRYAPGSEITTRNSE